MPIPITSAEILLLSKSMLSYYTDKKPVDQVSTPRPFFEAMMAKAETFDGGDQIKTPIRIGRGPKGQSYKGASTVVYNQSQTTDMLAFDWGEIHDGLYITETELKENGFVVMDQQEPRKLAGAAKQQLIDLWEVKFGDKGSDLVNGMQDTLNDMLLLDGTQAANNFPGLDFLITLNPTTGIAGGRDRSLDTNWRNQVAKNLAPADIPAAIRAMVRATTVGGQGVPPDLYVCGLAFYQAVETLLDTNAKRNVGTDDQASFQLLDGEIKIGKGKLVWDPYFEQTDAAFPGATVPWTKRCYGINTNDLQFRYLPAPEGKGVQVDANGKSKKNIVAVRAPIRPNNQYLTMAALNATGGLIAKRMKSHFVAALA